MICGLEDQLRKDSDVSGARYYYESNPMTTRLKKQVKFLKSDCNTDFKKILLIRQNLTTLMYEKCQFQVLQDFQTEHMLMNNFMRPASPPTGPDAFLHDRKNRPGKLRTIVEGAGHRGCGTELPPDPSVPPPNTTTTVTAPLPSVPAGNLPSASGFSCSP
ncbi:hypothetical protein UY3_01518 [Chelonia mydas]|uniref:Uncharacterized protein n=1 Tax=Chelonia mydas TaxID=8469 RepID=M7CJQ9_CHEMY|nr:hypothetical protein UY3_01518 [Chelonia mydas]